MVHGLVSIKTRGRNEDQEETGGLEFCIEG